MCLLRVIPKSPCENNNSQANCAGPTLKMFLKVYFDVCGWRLSNNAKPFCLADFIMIIGCCLRW